MPEGGGSIIRYNNGKSNQTAYYSNLYGWDYGTERSVLINETRSNFPVYAMTANGSSFLCFLEEGATIAGINADVSGRNNSYNTASATFVVLHHDQYDVSAKTPERIYMFEKELPAVTVTERFRFLACDSYVELADAYGQYLEDAGRLGGRASEEQPIVISLIGAIEKSVKRAGVPVTDSVGLTTFAQAGEIVRELNAAGLDSLDIRYEGWANGGVAQRVFTRVKAENELGGRKALESFVREAQDAGNSVFLDGMTTFAYRSGIFQGFSLFTDAARYTTRDCVKLYPYSPIFYTELKYRDSYYLAKPSYSKRMADNFVSAAADLGANVSFRDLGYLVSGDYDTDHRTSREESAAIQRESLRAADERGLRVMIRSGNDYALGSVDVISDMDLFGNGYSIVDEDIPFYQIALHGRVDFASESLNMSGDWQNMLLRSAEYGSGLSFTFMAESADVLVDTHYTQYTGASWDAVKDDAVAALLRYRREMSGLNRQRITGHEYLTGAVTCTTYESGAKVYVNFGNAPYEADGVTVPARDYLVIREGDAQ